jgi:hypothetical protein
VVDRSGLPVRLGLTTGERTTIGLQQSSCPA